MRPQYLVPLFLIGIVCVLNFDLPTVHNAQINDVQINNMQINEVEINHMQINDVQSNAQLSVQGGTRGIPSLEFISPIEGDYLQNGEVEIEGYASDTSGIERIEFSIDFGPWMLANGTVSWYAIVHLPDGSHSLSVKATSKTGGLAIVTVNFYIDTVLPYFVFDYVPEITNRTNLTLTGNSEPNSKIACRTGSTYAGNDGKFALELHLDEGLNIRNVTSIDAAGNTYSREIRILVDSKPPTLHVQPIPPYSITRDILVSGYTENGASVTVNDANAELSSGEFSTIVHLVEGVNIIEVTATDRAGNKNSVYFQVIYDAIPPFLTVFPESTIVSKDYVNISGKTEVGAKVTVKGAAIEVNPDGTFSSVVNGLNPGINSFVVRAEDAAGNVREINIKVFRDSSCGLVIISPQNNSKTQFEKIQIFGLGEIGSNISINNIGVKMGKDGTFSMTATLSFGDNYFTIQGVDTLGNRASYSLHIVRERDIDANTNENELRKFVVPIGIILAGLVAAFLIVLYAEPANYHSYTYRIYNIRNYNYPPHTVNYYSENQSENYHSKSRVPQSVHNSAHTSLYPNNYSPHYSSYPLYPSENNMQSQSIDIQSNIQNQYIQNQSPSQNIPTQNMLKENTINNLRMEEREKAGVSNKTKPSTTQVQPSPLQLVSSRGLVSQTPIPTQKATIQPSQEISKETSNAKHTVPIPSETPLPSPQKSEGNIIMQVEEMKVDISSAPEIKLEIKPEPANKEITLEITRLGHDNDNLAHENEKKKPEITSSEINTKGTGTADTNTMDSIDINKKVEDEINESEKEVERIKGLGIEVGQSQTLLRLAKALLRSKNYDKASQYAKKATNIALELELRIKLNEKEK